MIFLVGNLIKRLHSKKKKCYNEYINKYRIIGLNLIPKFYVHEQEKFSIQEMTT
jgi:hypothetical protein